jgi:hypothetical protein
LNQNLCRLLSELLRHRNDFRIVNRSGEAIDVVCRGTVSCDYNLLLLAPLQEIGLLEVRVSLDLVY